jgi:hypothetical protein
MWNAIGTPEVGTKHGRKWRTWVAAAVLPLLLATGCSSMSNEGNGALVGTGVGAVAGGLLGSLVHAPVAGAVLGGVAGGVTGDLVGHDIDKQEEKKAVQAAYNQQAAAAVEAQKSWPTLMQIQQMSAGGTSDAIIINQIRTTRAVYTLRPEDIQWLQLNGVHDAVIQEMQATLTRAPQPVVYQPVPVGGPPPVVIYDDPPPVGVRIGWGPGYYRYRGW